MARYSAVDKINRLQKSLKCVTLRKPESDFLNHYVHLHPVNSLSVSRNLPRILNQQLCNLVIINRKATLWPYTLDCKLSGCMCICGEITPSGYQCKIYFVSLVIHYLRGSLVNGLRSGISLWADCTNCVHIIKLFRRNLIEIFFIIFKLFVR